MFNLPTLKVKGKPDDGFRSQERSHEPRLPFVAVVRNNLGEIERAVTPIPKPSVVRLPNLKSMRKLLSPISSSANLISGASDEEGSPKLPKTPSRRKWLERLCSKHGTADSPSPFSSPLGAAHADVRFEKNLSDLSKGSDVSKASDFSAEATIDSTTTVLKHRVPTNKFNWDHHDQEEVVTTARVTSCDEFERSGRRSISPHPHQYRDKDLQDSGQGSTTSNTGSSSKKLSMFTQF